MLTDMQESKLPSTLHVPYHHCHASHFLPIYKLCQLVCVNGTVGSLAFDTCKFRSNYVASHYWHLPAVYHPPGEGPAISKELCC